MLYLIITDRIPQDTYNGQFCNSNSNCVDTLFLNLIFPSLVAYKFASIPSDQITSISFQYRVREDRNLTMSGIIKKIEETFHVGDHKPEEHHVEHKPEHHGGEHKSEHHGGEHKAEHKEGFLDGIKDKIHGGEGHENKDEKKKKKKEKKHEHGHDHHGHD
ncbi:Dehydrin-10 [Quillaja saponaria]|uniref:Dehydrin-10 n=1 Tax=Quillaja saponaria TaxID=32244 RepID=A0AAD7Q7R6_QUISA|nr:Dehydrin-10 [Quillaja saponaria]